MLRKILILMALVTGLAFSSAPRDAAAATCKEECYQSWGSCCSFAAYCQPYYQDCLDSCDRGVGPWLIC